MKSFTVLFLILAVLSVVSTTVNAAGDNYERQGRISTKERFEERQLMRNERLKEMQAKKEAILDAHKSGRNLLERQDLEKVQKQVEMIQKKIDRAAGMDERDKRMMMEREMQKQKIRDERMSKDRYARR
mmetsp:Transcript_9989/g.11458  ORF Transcript_9989/g.11458 Transcript_9989/m.11458 type:complete len:129 (+) Transcript_9989:86-472(+)|eukprot:CAMPEP_0194353388 /NCGR_PEP_ID=MMETSP0174-20130528/1703_1 /TAXON_ID=216777 /ORGANISM="Proboscia alata, Strain PI-D3" /LENGTH=128 /DNA_ID=CAMNT_0039121901 /DNA_START=62 /DNA_END=448 /DNA_ORIENTATION=+